MDRVSVCRRAVQLGSFSSVSQCHTVLSVLCPLDIFAVQADDDGSGGGIASWVASTAALPFPHGHTQIELGQQRCADRKKSKPNRIEIELWIEKSNRNRSKSIKPNRNITSDVINQRLQIRRIGYRSAVALPSPMLQITANVRHYYRYDTNFLD